MTQNREEILADFQACTGIDDVAVAIYHLDEAHWDLVTAVNQAISQEPQVADQMANPVIEMPPEVDQGAAQDAALPPPILMDHHMMDHVPSTSAATSEPSSSNSTDNKNKELSFRIKYNQKTLNITLAANKSLADLKAKISKQTGIPQNQQMLSGWRTSPQTECLLLSALSLPRLNSLNLAVVPTVAMADNKVAERLSLTYTLIVEYGGKSYHLKFPGSRTVFEVKNDVYTITDIPVRHQVWTGWPDSVTDDKIMLASADLDHPEHKLSVQRAPQPTSSSPSPEAKRKITDAQDSDSSVEEFEDASESFTGDEDPDYMMEDVSSKKLQPLIPPDTEDEMLGAIHFAEEFTNRYGGAHPHFFPGTLEDALKESCLKPAKDRRLLAVYLHHDWSVLSNVFCTQLLGFESVLQHLSNYFVVWGWDLTHESNKNILLESVNRNLGKIAEMTVRRLETNKLPALIIIMRVRSTTEIFTIVHGNVGANELLTSLMQSVDVFTEQQASYMRDEEERAAREMIKTEQDRAYQASLAVDRAKEESKKQQELLQERERERIEHERQQQEAIREAHRREVERELPPEPEGGAGDAITKIRYRLPGGRNIERRFRVTDTLKALLDFLTVEGFPVDSYKVISGWPRRDLTTLDMSQTLSELRLCPQETVIIEERSTV